MYVLRFFTAWVLISLLAFCEEVSAIRAHDFDILLFLMRYFCQLCNLFVFWPFVFFFNLRVGAKPGLSGPARTVHGLARPGPESRGPGRPGFKRPPDVGFFLSMCFTKKKPVVQKRIFAPGSVFHKWLANYVFVLLFFLKKCFPPNPILTWSGM